MTDDIIKAARSSLQALCQFLDMRLSASSIQAGGEYKMEVIKAFDFADDLIQSSKEADLQAIAASEERDRILEHCRNAENERDAAIKHAGTMEGALREVARLGVNMRSDFSRSADQSRIARQALGESE